ncbi:MAG: hypothetical protein ACRD4R_02005 [Candidatus Acidiferrales bacterium]
MKRLTAVLAVLLMAASTGAAWDSVFHVSEISSRPVAPGADGNPMETWTVKGHVHGGHAEITAECTSASWSVPTKLNGQPMTMLPCIVPEAGEDYVASVSSTSLGFKPDKPQCATCLQPGYDIVSEKER